MAALDAHPALGTPTVEERDDFYVDYLDDIARRQVNATVSNADPEHARYAISKLLGDAQRSVRIFPAANDLGKGGIYDSAEVFGAAKSLLSKDGATLVVVLPSRMCEADVEDVPFVSGMRRLENQGSIAGTMEVRSAPQGAEEFLEAHDFGHRMVVMDESAFRIEGAGGTDAAYVNFGNAKDARRLAGLFDDVLVDQGAVLTRVGR